MAQNTRSLLGWWVHSSLLEIQQLIIFRVTSNDVSLYAEIYFPMNKKVTCLRIVLIDTMFLFIGCANLF